jgi:hypothetical protein
LRALLVDKIQKAFAMVSAWSRGMTSRPTTGLQSARRRYPRRTWEDESGAGLGRTDKTKTDAQPLTLCWEAWGQRQGEPRPLW